MPDQRSALDFDVACATYHSDEARVQVEEVLDDNDGSFNAAMLVALLNLR